MPDLAAIQNTYAAFGVQVIGASTDEAGDRAKVLQFIKDTKINFPIWMGATSSDMLRFGLGTALPGSVVIGKDGRIAQVVSGIVNQADLKKQIDAMLSADVATIGEPVEARKDVAATPKRPADVSSVPS